MTMWKFPSMVKIEVSIFHFTLKWFSFVNLLFSSFDSQLPVDDNFIDWRVFKRLSYRWTA